MVAKYHNLPQHDHRDYDLECGYEEGSHTPGFLLRMLSHICTFLSYTAFLIFLPVTYWFCIKKVDPAHRIIIFRLGTLIGSRGPGRVLIFPWIDRTLTVDVSNSAFSVPPQQLITHDGGIIEIGAEVHYAVTDCVALVSQVADYQEMLRSLAKTVLIRLTVKQTIAQLNKEKHKCESSVKDEINGQVRKWGLDIRLVEFCEIKVLKTPEKEGGIPPLLATLSKSSGNITPAEFANYLYSTEQQNKQGHQISNDLKSLVEAAEEEKITWLRCFQKMIQLEKFDTEQYGSYIFILTDICKRILVEISETPTAVDIDDSENNAASDDNNINNLQSQNQGEPNAGILENNDDPNNQPLHNNDTTTVVNEIHNLLQADTQALVNGSNMIVTGNIPEGLSRNLPSAHITISLTSSDLAGVLKGSLPSLQAYLTNRINVSGDVRYLMLLERFGSKVHKPGQPFNV